MKEKILALSQDLQKEMVKIRRDFHRHAETGWTEFRTTSIIAKHLEELNLEVLLGDDAIQEAAMMGVPSAAELEKEMERAKAQGAHTQYFDKMKGGKTGVVGILKTGKSGPVVGYRFDIDANDLNETTDAEHFPNKEGFASINPGAMHGCGHDGHAVIGMGLAKVLCEIKDQLTGTIKFFFQPAEEGVRGANAMVQTGLFDDIDYMFAAHIGVQADTGELYCSRANLLATTKLDAIYTGVPAHAGAKPEEGKSALLAAASGALALQGIYRHSAGNSRINIGVLQAGTGRNVVPPNALMKIETRGATSEIDAFVKAEAIRMIHGSAKTYDVEVEIKEMGGAMAIKCDPEMITFTKEAATELGIFKKIEDEATKGGSEDYSFMVNRVQSKGGKATFVLLGADRPANSHTNTFDFDEACLSHGVALFAMIAYKLGQK